MPRRHLDIQNVTGRINAIQAKAGRWNLGISFKNLQPGIVYRLWGNRDGTPVAGAVGGDSPVATAAAAADGTLSFSYQTSDPTNLGFDLNSIAGPWDLNGVTIVTSYWSQQMIKVLSPDGALVRPVATGRALTVLLLVHGSLKLQRRPIFSLVRCACARV